MPTLGSTVLFAAATIGALLAAGCRPAEMPRAPTPRESFARQRDVVFGSYFQRMTAGRCVECHTGSGPGVAKLDMKTGSAADIEESFVRVGLLPACGQPGGTIDTHASPLRWYNIDGNMPHRGVVTPDLATFEEWLRRYRTATRAECGILETASPLTKPSADREATRSGPSRPSPTPR